MGKIWKDSPTDKHGKLINRECVRPHSNFKAANFSYDNHNGIQLSHSQLQSINFEGSKVNKSNCAKLINIKIDTLNLKQIDKFKSIFKVKDG